MRILHVIQRYWPYVGGSERQFQEFSERLARDGHDVTVFSTDAWDLELFWARGKRRIPEEREQHNGVAIRRFPVRHIAPHWTAYPAIRRVMLTLSDLPFDTTALIYPLARLTPWVPALEKALLDESLEFDLVAGMNIVFDALLAPAARYARRRGIPYILHPLTHLGEAGDRKVRRFYTMRHQARLLREADAVILQNEAERAALLELGVEPERMHLVGSGVNPDEISGGQADRCRSKLGIVGPLVAFLGTAAYDKGAHHAIEAMKLLWERGCTAPLVFAGPAMEQFTSFYRGQPEVVRSKCRVLGFVSEEDKRDLLAACSLLILPSRTESFGIVFPEAWMYDKPVIGARAGGIPEVITDGVDGFLVPFGDVSALAGRIRLLLADADLAQRMGEAGHRKTVESLTWDCKYALLRQVYESVYAAGRRLT